jgi:flagellar P-ring protein precursor FlgI
MMLRTIFFLLAVLVSFQGHAATRIKDVAAVQGVRDNQLIGYGLVMGLQGTGDTLRNSQFTEQSLQSMLDRMGVNVRDINLRTRNVAAVIVTADLPPFVGAGSRIDVTVTSMGDATSLKGGTLMLTALQGGDGQVYAVGQGAIVVSGFSAQGQAETLTSGVATAGRIPNGALIEREVQGGFDTVGPLAFELKNPDYKTATLITDAINRYSQQRYGVRVASPRDFRTVVLHKPKNVAATRFIAELGDLEIRPDTPARIVVDQRTGTVVIGKNVQISTVAITHGALTIRVTENPEVSQPDRGADLQTLVKGLNQMGLKPSDVIAILQAVKTAGALQAELVIQ